MILRSHPIRGGRHSRDRSGPLLPQAPCRFLARVLHRGSRLRAHQPCGLPHGRHRSSFPDGRPGVSPDSGGAVVHAGLPPLRRLRPGSCRADQALCGRSNRDHRLSLLGGHVPPQKFLTPAKPGLFQAVRRAATCRGNADSQKSPPCLPLRAAYCFRLPLF